jgi:hypothetical protein
VPGLFSPSLFIASVFPPVCSAVSAQLRVAAVLEQLRVVAPVAEQLHAVAAVSVRPRVVAPVAEQLHAAAAVSVRPRALAPVAEQLRVVAALSVRPRALAALLECSLCGPYSHALAVSLRRFRSYVHLSRQRLCVQCYVLAA